MFRDWYHLEKEICWHIHIYVYWFMHICTCLMVSIFVQRYMSVRMHTYDWRTRYPRLSKDIIRIWGYTYMINIYSQPLLFLEDIQGLRLRCWSIAESWTRWVPTEPDRFSRFLSLKLCATSISQLYMYIYIYEQVNEIPWNDFIQCYSFLVGTREVRQAKECS